MSVAATMMILLNLSMTLTAQTTATWKGGKPGRGTSLPTGESLEDQTILARRLSLPMW